MQFYTWNIRKKILVGNKTKLEHGQADKLSERLLAPSEVGTTITLRKKDLISFS